MYSIIFLMMSVIALPFLLNLLWFELDGVEQILITGVWVAMATIFAHHTTYKFYNLIYYSSAPWLEKLKFRARYNP